VKAYTGGDASIEALQRRRGFKTYRDLYNKRMNELEVQSRQLREQQKENLAS
jgi:intraflagellar transport protein 81